ncbi:MAG TPA: hypothetical protein ENI23_00025 [bacterium]|nr:hypothetical protein [bacterium]
MDIGVLEYGLLGLVFAIVMALIELLRFVITKYSKNGNNGSSKKNSEQDVQLAVFATQLAEIKDNHLVHINSELAKNRKDHEFMATKLTSIDTKIGFLIDNK